MAKLSSKARKSLPKSDFLGPGRTFPGNDKNHLRAAISGTTRAKNAGNISAKTDDTIQAKARAKLDSHRSSRGFK